ncbi:hypothetical protein D6I95_07180 [Alcaligenes faecalis]|nr:hypothetical protein D6I95_07180 [Alcaligenes faecalis]
MGDIKKNCKIKDLATVYRLWVDRWEIESREDDWMLASKQCRGLLQFTGFLARLGGGIALARLMGLRFINKP